MNKIHSSGSSGRSGAPAGLASGAPARHYLIFDLMRFIFNTLLSHYIYRWWWAVVGGGWAKYEIKKYTKYMKYENIQNI